MKLFYILIFFLALSYSAQTKKFHKQSPAQQARLSPLPFDANGFMTSPDSNIADIVLKSIDEKQLPVLLNRSKAELTCVVLLATGCAGTVGAFEYVNEMNKKYENKVNIIVIFTDDYSNTGIMKKEIIKFKYNKGAYVVDQAYGEFGDDRKKGYILRNNLCPECNSDIIGVPYFMVYNKSKLLFHGYRGYHTTIPVDLITYFMENNP